MLIYKCQTDFANENKNSKIKFYCKIHFQSCVFTKNKIVLPDFLSNFGHIGNIITKSLTNLFIITHLNKSIIIGNNENRIALKLTEKIQKSIILIKQFG